MIPLPLSQWIAKCYRLGSENGAGSSALVPAGPTYQATTLIQEGTRNEQ